MGNQAPGGQARRLPRHDQEVRSSQEAVRAGVPVLHLNRTASDPVSAGLDLSRAEPGDNWTTLSPDLLRPTKTHGVKEPLVGETVPLIQIVGYGFRNYGSRFDKLTMSILTEQSVEPPRFYIKEAEELSNEGEFGRHPSSPRT